MQNPIGNHIQQIKQPSYQQIKKVQEYEIYLDIKLGKGQYGHVYLARNTNETSPDKMYQAVKVIPNQNDQRSHIQKQNNDMLQKEIDVLKKANHPNLVCLHQLYKTQNNLYLFIDYCNGGDLTSYWKSKNKQLTSEETVEFLRQIVAGYKTLYDQNIIHRDLKLDNILVHNGEIKIADFGFGRFIDGDMEKQVFMSMKYTPVYGSPQLLKNQKYSSKSDVWSLGIILYELIMGKYPFSIQNLNALVCDIEYQVGNNRKLKIPINQKNQLTADLVDLIQNMLVIEESNRISWKQIFEHPLIQNDQDNDSVSTDITNSNIEEDEQQFGKSIIKIQKQVQNNQQIKNAPLNIVQPSITVVNQNSSLSKSQNKPKIFSQPKNYCKENDDKHVIQKLKPFEQQNSIDKSNELNEDVNIKNYKIYQIQQQKALNIYKKLLFIRNRSCFVNQILFKIWESRKQFNSKDFYIKILIYFQGGYYYENIKCILDWLHYINPDCANKKSYFSYEDLLTFKESNKYQKCCQELQKDKNCASEFYENYQVELLKLLNSKLSQNKNDRQLSNQEVKDIIFTVQFIQARQQNTFIKIQEYIKNGQYIFQKIKQNINKQNLDLTGLNAYYYCLIFTKIDMFMPLSKYLQFDFYKFQEQELKLQDKNTILEKIQLYDQNNY